jgi:predicted lipid carrier protein YhbT
VASGLELGLDQEDQLRAVGSHSDQRGNHGSQRDERQVRYHQVGTRGEPFGAEVTDVHPFEHIDSGILAEGPRQLAVSDVHRGDVLGPLAKEHVREAASRGSRVEATASGWIDRESPQGPRELLSASGDISSWSRGELHGILRSHHGSRLRRRPAVHGDVAGGHGLAGLVEGDCQASSNQLEVQPAAIHPEEEPPPGRERVAAVDRVDVLLFRAEDFLAVAFLRGVDFLADFEEDLEGPDRSNSRTRRRRVSTSSLVASPEREICRRTSRLIVSLNRSLLRRDQSSSCRVRADAWSRRASPCRTRAWAKSWALRGVRASFPASMKRRRVSSTAERIHRHPPGIIPPVSLRPGDRLASKEEVERHLRDLIARLVRSDDGASELKRALPERRVLALRVSDLGTDYWTELEGGRLGVLREGSPPDRDILMTASSDDLVDLVEGKGSLFSAYLSGRIRIDASVSDLLRLRKLL